MRSLLSKTTLAALLMIGGNIYAGEPSACKPDEIESNGGKLYLVTLTSPPPSRMQIIFTKRNSDKVRIAEFDPFLAPRKAAYVYLPEGIWEVSSWSEPLRDPGNFARNYAWQISNQGCSSPPYLPVAAIAALMSVSAVTAGPLAVADKVRKGQTEAMRSSSSPDKNAMLMSSSDQGGQDKLGAELSRCVSFEICHSAGSGLEKVGGVTISPVSNDDTLASASKSLSTSSSNGPALSGRAFGAGSSAIADELLSTVAEVVVERARGRASKILANKLTAILCKELVIPNVMISINSRVTEKEEKNVPLLPTACKLVENARVEDLLGTGKQFLNAIETDLALFATNGLSALLGNTLAEKIELDANSDVAQSLSSSIGSIFKELSSQINRQSRDQGLHGSLDAQRLLLVFAKQNWEKLRGSTVTFQNPQLKSVFLGVQLGFAVMQRCHQQSCDLRMVRESLDNAAQLFKIEPEIKDFNIKLDAVWPDLDQFVLKGISVLSPPKGATAANQTAAVLDLVFDFLQHVQEFTADEDGSKAQWKLVLQHSRTLLQGAVRSDLQSVLMSFAGVIEPALAILNISVNQKSTIIKALGDYKECMGAQLVMLKTVKKENAKEISNALKRCSLNFLTTKKLAAAKLPSFQRLISSFPTYALRLQSIEPYSDAGKKFEALMKELDKTGESGANRDLIAETANAYGNELSKFLSGEEYKQLLSSSTSEEKAWSGWQKDLQALRPFFEKAAKVLSAGGAYLSTNLSNEGLSPEQQKVQHQARKRAIESLLDAATSRSERDGDVIVSLGANVGFMAGKQWLRPLAPPATVVDGTMPDASSAGCSSGGCWLYPQLSLPVGVAVQLLPNKHRSTCFLRPLGLHFQFSALDLAQYVAYDSQGTLSSPTWTSAITLGGQVGIIVGSAQTNFIIGFDGRYAPTLFPAEPGRIESGGAVRLGAFAGMYIPFLDFN